MATARRGSASSVDSARVVRAHGEHARKLLALAGTLAFMLSTASVHALGADGEPIDTSDYTIDVYEGPNLANARIVALAGAVGPIAPGVQGFPYNPSAVVARPPWSTEWFDWELDGGITLPGSVTTSDFDNNGDESFASETSLFATGGGRLSFGDAAIGVLIDLNLFEARSRESTELLNVSLTRAMLVGGYSFLDGELLTGIGLGANVISMNAQGSATLGESTGVDVSGGSLHLGATWAPDYLPLRVGLGARLSPPADWLPDAAPEGVEPDENGNYIEQGYVLPRTLSLPSEVHFAVGLSLFRPMNFRWINPHDEPMNETRTAQAERDAAIDAWERAAEQRRRDAATDEARDALAARLDREREALEDEHDERIDDAKERDRQRRLKPYRTMPREKLLIAAALKVTAPTPDGVGVESFLRQEVERSGENVSWSPRLGIEGEAIPGYLILRGGSYYEPTRFPRSTGRVHGTTGLDVRIPIEWSVFGLFDDDTTFRVGGALDLADRYFGWGVSAGVWR